MNPKLYILFAFILFTVYSLLFTPVRAARQRSRKPHGGASVSFPQGVRATVRFRPDRLGLVLTFSNFANLQSGRYELIYESNGVTQGAGGSIILNDSGEKEILFGTCSGGVCTFHENITNARLSVVSTLKDGTTVLKPFRIKV